MFPYRYSLNGYISFTYFRLAKKSIINPKHKKFAQKLHTWSKKKTLPQKKQNTQTVVLFDHLKKMTFFCKIVVFVQAFLSFVGTPCGTCLSIFGAKL